MVTVFPLLEVRRGSASVRTRRSQRSKGWARKKNYRDASSHCRRCLRTCAAPRRGTVKCLHRDSATTHEAEASRSLPRARVLCRPRTGPAARPYSRARQGTDLGDRLHGLSRGVLRGERPLPPADVDSAGPFTAGPARSCRHLFAHCGHIHALWAARHVHGMGCLGTVSRLGRGSSCDSAEALLAADPEVGLVCDWSGARLGRRRRDLPASEGQLGGHPAGCCGRTFVFGRSDCLRRTASRPCAAGLWLSRTLSRPHACRGRLPVRGDCILRAPSRLTKARESASALLRLG
jgi:hypothetical protein